MPSPNPSRNCDSSSVRLLIAVQRQGQSPHFIPGTHTLKIAQPRSFLTRAYPTMKKNNPHTPIMLREALNTAPTVFARYGELRSLHWVQARANAYTRLRPGKARIIKWYGASDFVEINFTKLIVVAKVSMTKRSKKGLPD